MKDGRSWTIVSAVDVPGVTALSVQVTLRVATTPDIVTEVGGFVANAMPGRFTASVNVSGVTFGVRSTLETGLPAAVTVKLAD